MRRIFAQVRKELTQLVRDRLALTLALLLPAFLLLLMGTAISLTVDDMPIVVQDLDGSQASQRLLDAFRASLTFHIVAWPAQIPPAKALVGNGVRGVLIIPEHFGRDLARQMRRRCSRRRRLTPTPPNPSRATPNRSSVCTTRAHRHASARHSRDSPVVQSRAGLESF